MVYGDVSLRRSTVGDASAVGVVSLFIVSFASTLLWCDVVVAALHSAVAVVVVCFCVDRC